MQIRDYPEIELIRISYYFTFGTIFGTIFGARKLFFKKIHSRGNSCNTDASAYCIYHFTLQNFQSSAQNPFRAEDFCSIIIETHQKSHRSPIDLPQISLFSSMLALIPQSGDFSGATLGVRSVALLQVPKPVGNFTPDLAK